MVTAWESESNPCLAVSTLRKGLHFGYKVRGKAHVLLDFPFASMMALNAPMVAGVIVLVVMVFGIAAMYNRRKRKPPVCTIQNLGAPLLVLITMSSKVW